ncbi:unnamed protein product [Rotaria sp. Silwood2]|nr:unnamed protein product [Rotaria sp. Silwood2]
MLEKVRIISNRLQEICEIDTKYSRVFIRFSKKTIVKDWKNDLSNYLIELSDEMKTLNHTDQIEALNTKLSIVQALRKLDWFLEGEKFTDIYRTYQNIIFEKISGVSQQIIDAIKEFDYQRVADKMMALQSSNEVGKHYYAEVKQSLNASLNLLMDGTKAQAITLGNNIEIEEIKLIVENLKRIERARHFIENT